MRATFRANKRGRLPKEEISSGPRKHSTEARTDMPAQDRELYSSPNGDRWYLVRESETAKSFVRHKANLPSGGQVSDIDISEFLSRDREHPERQALLQLIGTLVERHTQHTGRGSRSTRLFHQSRSQRADSAPYPSPKRKRQEQRHD